MKTKLKKTLVLCVAMIMMLSSAITVCATGTTSKEADEALAEYITSQGSQNGSYDKKTYPCEGGGYHTYSELVKKNEVQTGYVVESAFEDLTSKGKEDLLIDMIDASNEAVEKDSNIGSANLKLVSSETQTTWLNNLQNCSGVGSQLMTTLLSNTKPDYATANRIYEPFSGVVGTILGLGSILIMAFLAITMVLDLSYIGIPAFRMLVDGEDGQGGQGGGKPKFISYEAVSAVQMAEGGNGGAGQNGGSNKAAVGIYFKKRVIMLVILGICLLYLIQGEIFTLVGWILDLVRGFLGF